MPNSFTAEFIFCILSGFLKFPFCFSNINRFILKVKNLLTDLHYHDYVHVNDCKDK